MNILTAPIKNVATLTIAIIAIVLLLGYSFYQVHTAAYNQGFYVSRNQWRESIIQEMKNVDEIETKKYVLRMKRLNGDVIVNIVDK